MTTKFTSNSSNNNLAGAVMFICVTVLIIFFAGDPDIADGIIAWLRGG